MSESKMRMSLIKSLKPLDAVPIESHMRAGIPDVNCIVGEIECKYLDRWVRGCDVNPVKLSHPLLPAQGVFANRRTRLGGISLVCIKVGRMEWFFFDGLDARHIIGKITRPEMHEKALKYFNGMNDKELIDWLVSLWYAKAMDMYNAI